MSIATPPLDWPHYGIGFLDALKRGFKKYATFTGRASRSEFWWWVLANSLVGLVLYVLTAVLGVATQTRSGEFGVGGIIFAVLLGIWGLAVIVPNIAITVRRLHDAGYSGWFYLLNLIPSVGGIIVLVLCAMQTSPNAVKYGPPAPEGYAPGAYGNANPGYAPPAGPTV